MNGTEMEQIGTGLIMRELIRENFRFSVQMVNSSSSQTNARKRNLGE